MHSQIAADGAFVQSVIPSASGPGDGLGGLGTLAPPDRYRNARGQEMQSVRTFDERRDIVNGKPVLFFRRQPGGDWFTVPDKKTEVFRNGRSLGLRQDYSGAKKVIGPVALGLNLPIDPGWAAIFRRLAHDLVPVDPEKFIEEILETGEFWLPLLHFAAADLKAILLLEFGGSVLGKAAASLNKRLDQLVGNLLRRARLKQAASSAGKARVPKPPQAANLKPAPQPPKSGNPGGGAAPTGRPSAKPAAPREGVWELGPGQRGEEIEKRLGQNLPQNYPVFDRISNGVGTSIMSMDLRAPTYADPAAITRVGQGYIDKVAAFRPKPWAGFDTKQSQITKRGLDLAIPPNATAAQREALEALKVYGQTKFDFCTLGGQGDRVFQ